MACVLSEGSIVKIAGIKLEGIRLVKTSNLKQTQGLDMLIGMDVIQNGRMVIQCSESEKVLNLFLISKS